MIDFSHLASSTKADVQVFVGIDSTQKMMWLKPRGCSMAYILGIGPGGSGGNGAVGAASTAAGGGGGGSGAQVSLLVPIMFLPDKLFCSPGYSTFATTVATVHQGVIYESNVLLARQGGGAGNATGATAGGGGSGGTLPTIDEQPLAGLGRYNFLAGQAGTSGGSTGVGANLSLPTTGLVVTGGTGGGGLPAFPSVGAGGAFTVAGSFPPHFGGPGATGSNSPGGDGSHGFDKVIPGLRYSYGGTGGGSSYAVATGFGLVGGNGGNGAPGCGGGGGGGALTGSTQGLGGKGGPGLVIIIAW